MAVTKKQNAFHAVSPLAEEVSWSRVSATIPAARGESTPSSIRPTDRSLPVLVKSADDLDRMHRALTRKVSYLEELLDDVDEAHRRQVFLSYVRSALRVRECLVQCAGFASPAPGAVNPTMENLLAAVLDRIYRWTIAHLDWIEAIVATSFAVPHGESPRIPGELDILMCELVDRCEGWNAMGDALVRMETAIAELTERGAWVRLLALAGADLPSRN